MTTTPHMPLVDVQRTRMIMAACDGLISNPVASIGSQIRIDVRPQGAARWRATLFASDSPAGIDAVAKREADIAIVNPSAMLTLAYRGGNRHFPTPLPLRAITVMPQHDYVGLAVRADLGFHYLEDLAESRHPLRISWRGNRPDHSIHMILPDILDAAGCPIHAIESWGGRVYHDEGLVPAFTRAGERPRTDLVKAGDRDAIFDEAVPGWWREATDAGMELLSLRPETLEKLTALGYRQTVIRKDEFVGLPRDVQTIDFSGWPVFTHLDTPDAVVAAFCAGIEANRERIPWEADSPTIRIGEGPFPLERMCNGSPDAPLEVPFHPAAERYWREHGYLA